MSIEAGTYTFGPENAELLVHTRRTGPAAKAGHDLVIEITSWTGRLELGEEASVQLNADGGSLRVREGRGIQTLGDDDKAGIKQSIDDDVLKRTAIEFRSRTVEQAGDVLTVQGDLNLRGATGPITFDLTATEAGRLAGSATVKQTDWGIKPFSILFGTIKVVDEVTITIDAKL